MSTLSTTLLTLIIKLLEEKKSNIANPNQIELNSANPNQIERELVKLQKKCKTTLDRTKQEEKLQLLIIILPDFKGKSYDRIKRKCETDLRIISQCCQPRQTVKMKKQYLENLALKINVKSRGRNTMLNDAFEKIIPLVNTNTPCCFFLHQLCTLVL
ncbi:unnamed protein product [Lathyrus sativus]|nr:unnamed protein product [Lathyrus sativus]